MPLELSVTVSVAVRVPVVLGVKVTVIVQLPVVAANAAVVHVLVCVKSVAGEIDTLDTVSAALPVLLKVSDCVADDDPTTVGAKVRDAGDGLKSASPAVPVPVSVATCGWFAALSTTATAPFWTPAAVGVKVTVTVQLALAASDPPQVFVCEKSIAPDRLSETTTFVIVIALPDPFVRVNVCGAEDA
jgi:hypothetical protein